MKDPIVRVFEFTGRVTKKSITETIDMLAYENTLDGISDEVQANSLFLISNLESLRDKTTEDTAKLCMDLNWDLP